MEISKHVFPEIGPDRRAFCPDEPLNLKVLLTAAGRTSGIGKPGRDA
jgi:hypothetical protein